MKKKSERNCYTRGIKLLLRFQLTCLLLLTCALVFYLTVTSMKLQSKQRIHDRLLSDMFGFQLTSRFKRIFYRTNETEALEQQ